MKKILLLISCFLLLASGCTGVIEETAPPQASVTPRPSQNLATMGVMPATATFMLTLTTNPSTGSTQVIVFHPESVPAQERSGSCWSSSAVLDREDAWRCMAGDDIYDPCFSMEGDGQAVICDTNPLDESKGFKLNLTASLPPHGTIAPEKSAWVFELPDGTDCSFMGGATAAFDGQRVNYSCSDGWFILGELQEGQVWTAQKVRLSSDLSSVVESIRVTIKIVWI